MRSGRRSWRGEALRSAWALMTAGVLVAAAGCDSGPSGPGTLPAAVVPAEGIELGAVVLAVTGPGVTGFSPLGSTWLFSARVTQAGTWRVVLVNAAPGDMVFGIDVDDVTAEPPVVAAVQGVDSENRRLVSLLGLEFAVERP